MKTSPPTVKLGSALLVASIMLAALIHAHPERLRAPAWVAYLCAALFGFAGVIVIARALALENAARWLACALLGGMALVPGWIAFGSGARQCTAGSFATRSGVSEGVCRGAFGVGAAIVALMFVAALRGALQSREAAS